MHKPIPLTGYFKRGSSWRISLTRKNPDGTPIDLSDLQTRAMFRTDGADGPLVLTLTDGAGIAIPNPLTGEITLAISRTQSALFGDGQRVYFDVEQTRASDPDYAWQSLTYWFPVIEQVTRDD